MIRIFGMTINSKTNIIKGICFVLGLGFKSSVKVCHYCSISIYARFDDLSLRQKNALLNYLGNHFILGSNLEQSIFYNIKQKVLNKTYAGFRHSRGLPVRGQRTKTNASTSRKIKFKD